MSNKRIDDLLIGRHQTLELSLREFVVGQSVREVVDEAKRIVADPDFLAQVGFVRHGHAHDISPPANNTHFRFRLKSWPARLHVNHSRTHRALKTVDQPGNESVRN